MNDIARFIAEGKASLGIEFGSTRIKAVLVGPDFAPVAQGAFDWENRLEDGVWTYHDDEIWAGLRAAYAALAADVKARHGVALERLAAIGFSAMMHGYLAFDASGTPACSAPVGSRRRAPSSVSVPASAPAGSTSGRRSRSFHGRPRGARSPS